MSQAPQQSGFVWQVTAPEETSASPSPWRPCPAASGCPTASWLLTPPPCSPPTPRPPACSHSSTHYCLWEFSPSASTPMQVCVGRRGTSVGAFHASFETSVLAVTTGKENKVREERKKLTTCFHFKPWIQTRWDIVWTLKTTMLE